MDDFGNSFSARSIKNLPMYGEDENGPFRYEYSVEEESYTIYEHGNPSNVLATYDRNAPEGEQYTGGLPHFKPFYPHDAGELSANPSDYMVMVTNGQGYSEESPTINITVNKVWGDESIITNEEVETSLIIEKIFDGSLVDSMTDEQKQNITFKVTGPNNFNETFTYGVDVADDYTWSDGVHRDACTWMDSMLTITKIERPAPTL